MVTFVDGYRLDADTLSSVARMLYEHPSIGVKPMLCFVHSIGCYIVVIARRKYPGDGWFVMTDSQNRESGWYYPIRTDD